MKIGALEFLEEIIAGWSSPVARQAHNLKVVGSNPTPATNAAAERPRRPTKRYLRTSDRHAPPIVATRALAVPRWLTCAGIR